MKSWKIWLKGLIASAIGGASKAISVIVVAPQDFNFGDGLGNLAKVAAWAAVISAALYLSKSPLPNGNEEK